ncbi:ABC transporter substrate-binding protein [Ectothiorhodospiraceae bacterium BW-2]|nr:ABC transporter substrate-binding protein [Ectothiorhodospiraceae bacterium BW-2]
MMRYGVLFLLLSLWGVAQPAPISVFVSVLPLQALVSGIGGERVAVESLVRPGHSPATYDPTPQQIAALSKAKLYLRVGVPFEDSWMERIRSANGEMEIVDLRQGLPLRRLEAHHHDAEQRDEHEHEHEAEALDPHLWTSPQLVMMMISTIRDRLTALEPTQKEYFAANHQRLLSQLQQLDQSLARQLEPYAGRQFLVFHPSWGYFADRYRLQQVAIEHQGKQPGARAVTQLIEQARQEGIKVVFVQPQFDQRQAAQIAAAIGGEVIAVDPLAEEYFVNLHRVGEQFVRAFSSAN